MQENAVPMALDQDETISTLSIFDAGSTYIVTHRVDCDGDPGHHEEHDDEKHYYDVPFLRAHSNRTTPLRGLRRLSSPEWLLEDHPDISFVICNVYDCYGYHEKIMDRFERLQMPLGMSEEVSAQVRPYYSVLLKDAAPAERERQVLIPSKGLTRAIAALKSSCLASLHEWDTEENLTYPYVQLWHCKDEIQDASSDLPDSTQRHHLQALLSYLETSAAAEWHEAEQLFSQGQVNKKHWAKLYRPNDLIVTMEDGEPLAFVAKSCPDMNEGWLDLDCWSWDFDGEFYLRGTSPRVEWPSKSDTIAISELAYFPLRFNNTGLEKRLRRRGDIFWSCRTRRYVSYSVAPDETSVQSIQLRYMVDTKTYQMLHGSDILGGTHKDLDARAMLSDDPPSQTQYPHFILLLPSKIRGYGFHNKKWSELHVGRIEDIKWDKNVFKSDLVMDRSKKELIEALVTVHLKRKASTRSTKADFMTGKGEGLLILLHGGPGTGKTLTAESVAELAERPLYRVTCGDVGTNPETVEKYLNSVMFIGDTWNCVVLLDEADVFMEERTKLDLERNALVSVFLRVLEYYQGILILTSNRIGTFDEAFKSRIQLSLHYPPLSEKNRMDVWDNFIEHSRQSDDDIDFDGILDKVRRLARHKLNGRQIRNTLNTARQLAQFRGQRLEYSHLEQAIKNVVEFETYVTKLHDGQTDEEYAETIGIRHGDMKAEGDFD